MRRVAITDVGCDYKQELISQQLAYSYPWAAGLPRHLTILHLYSGSHGL